MKVRYADKTDYSEIIKVLREFQKETTLNKYPSPTDEYLHNLIVRSHLGGILLVAEQDNKIVGVIVSIITSNMWIPDIYNLLELAWYVIPEYRGTTAGARLFQKYKQEGDKLIEEGRIEYFTINLLDNSPDIDMESKGFSYGEKTFIRGEY